VNLTAIALLCRAVLLSCCYRTGCYAGHTGSIVQLLVLAEQLLSLGKDGQLLVWKIGEHEQPQVRDTYAVRRPFTNPVLCDRAVSRKGCQLQMVMLPLHTQLVTNKHQAGHAAAATASKPVHTHCSSHLGAGQPLAGRATPISVPALTGINPV
jgi:hypothetical protein